ncbi:MAG: hypothetical protein GY913_33350 [Proteobacteria bacterium]|nr:hypothetical protein [Pseudomonadota bacterium]MCP4921813.1 hypothetical protein [Pseudomonadota bacterium]
MLLLALAACQKTEGNLGLRWSVDKALAVTGKHLDIELEEAGDVVVTCTSRDDDRDVHVVRSEGRTNHVVGVFGLLASSTYDCVIEAESGQDLWARGEFRTSTNRIPVGVEEGVVSGDTSAMTGVYTLTNPFEGGKSTNDQRLVILDPDGEIRWYHDVEDEMGSADASLAGPGELIYGGGYELTGAPRIIDMGHELLYAGPQPVTGGEYHHDVGLTASGLTAGLTTINGDGYLGWGVEIRDPDDGGALVWDWNSDDAVDRGELPAGSGDTYHPNALQVDEDDDGNPTHAWVNVRNLNRIVRIDIETGLIDVDLRGTSITDDGFYLPHDIHVEGDRLLLYNNGERKPGEHSSVREFQLDLIHGTYELDWEWTEDDWQEPAWGGADWLGDDRILLAIGHCPGCDGALDSSRARILEVDQVTDDVVWSYRWEDESVGLYRAERLEGCDVFANARFCPEVLE